MTFENALKSVITGLSETNELQNRYFLLCDSSGNLVNTIRADSLKANAYGYVIVGSL